MKFSRVLFAMLAVHHFFAFSGIAEPKMKSAIHQLSVQASPTLQGSGGLPAAQLKLDYGFVGIPGSGQDGGPLVGSGVVIGIVQISGCLGGALLEDLQIFAASNGLPAPRHSQVYVLNNTDSSDLSGLSSPESWFDLALINYTEAALDLETVYAFAPGATIIVSCAARPTTVAITNALGVAVGAGATVISMSFGEPEAVSDYGRMLDTQVIQELADQTVMSDYINRNYGNVNFIAAAGDSGDTTASFPASHPNVIAVGGTTDFGAMNQPVWPLGGGGMSRNYPFPFWQGAVLAQSLPLQNQIKTTPGATFAGRMIPDLSLEADPHTALAIHDWLQGGWAKVGGTSLAAPMMAGLIAQAQQLRSYYSGRPVSAIPNVHLAMYQAPSSLFFDVTTGLNGTYAALPGFDLASGRGVPRMTALADFLARMAQ